MMKYTAIVLLGLVALAIAGPIPEENEIEDFPVKKPSVWRLFPVDEAEVSKLKPGYESAADFCVNSRDHVKNYLVGALNSGASNIFSKFFDAFAEVTQETLDAQKRAAAEGAELIKSGRSVVVPSKIEGEPDKTENSIQYATKNIFLTAIEKLTNKSRAQIQDFMDSIKGENAREHILNACTTIQVDLKRSLEGQWNSYKKANGLSGQANSAGCVTVNRIYTLDNVCSLLNAAKDTIFPLFNL